MNLRIYRKSTPWVLLLLIAGLVGVALSSQTATAAGQTPLGVNNGVATPELKSTTVKGSGVTLPMGQAEIRDLASLSEAVGRSLESLKEQYAGARQFDRLLYRLQSMPGYVNAGNVSPNGDPQWVQLTDYPSDEVIKELQDLGRPTVVRYGGDLTDVSQSAASAALLNALQERGVLAPGTGEAGLDADGVGVRAKFTRLEDVSDVELEAAMRYAMEAAEKAVAPASAPISISEEPGREPLMAEVAIRGGHDLMNFGTFDCTTGFTAVRNGNDGVITAKHCPNALDYDNVSNTLTFVTGASDVADGEIDLQFHSTQSPNGTTAEFRAAQGDQRTVAAVVGTGVNAIACHYGGGTWREMPSTDGKRCSTVDNANRCRTVVWPSTGVGHTECYLADTENYISTGGDSGGPWFDVSDARGYHTAGNSTVGSVFTLISRVSANLNATVKQ